MSEDLTLSTFPGDNGSARGGIDVTTANNHCSNDRSSEKEKVYDNINNHSAPAGEERDGKPLDKNLRNSTTSTISTSSTVNSMIMPEGLEESLVTSYYPTSSTPANWKAPGYNNHTNNKQREVEDYASLSERKKQREKRRRQEISVAIDRLSNVFLKIDPTNFIQHNDQVYFVSGRDQGNKRGQNKKENGHFSNSSILYQGDEDEFDRSKQRTKTTRTHQHQHLLNRTAIINYATVLLEKLARESEETQIELLQLQHSLMTSNNNSNTNNNNNAGATIMMMTPAPSNTTTNFQFQQNMGHNPQEQQQQMMMNQQNMMMSNQMMMMNPNMNTSNQMMMVTPPSTIFSSSSLQQQQQPCFVPNTTPAHQQQMLQSGGVGHIVHPQPAYSQQQQLMMMMMPQKQQQGGRQQQDLMLGGASLTSPSAAVAGAKQNGAATSSTPVGAMAGSNCGNI